MDTDAGCTLVAVGDLFLDRPDPASAFRPVADLFAGHDIVFGNLEAPVSTRGELPPWASKFPLRMRPEMVPGLVSAGFSVLSLANNHTMDYGAQALLDTVDSVGAAGIATAGAGADLAAAEAPAVVTANGLRVGFLAFQATDHDRPDLSATEDRAGLNRLRVSPLYPAPHVDPADLDRLAACVAATCQNTDVVVVSVHWGLAGSWSLIEPQRGIADRAVRAGASLVLGHHTHVPQALALVQGVPVAYGLGNFVFDWSFPHFIPQRVVTEFRLDRTGVRQATIRMAVADPELRLLTFDDPVAASLGRRLCDLSAAEGTELRVDGDRLVAPIG